jgi:hypothetical protein
VVVQWLAWGVVVGAAVTGAPWLAWPSLFVLSLVWYASWQRRRHTLGVMQTLPRLTVTEGEKPADARSGGVTLIVPARNEEAAIEGTVRSLAALDYPDLEIVVVDDRSTDMTQQILDQLGEEFPEIRVFHDPPARTGWLGKANAIRYAVDRSDQTKPWLLFTDADVVFHPEAVRRAVNHAESHDLDFLTCLPRLETGSVAEAVLLPLGWRRLIAGVPVERVNDPDACPVGIGAFMLVRRDVYLRSGGHGAFAHHYAEDTLLAGSVKQAGGRMGVVWTPDLLRMRFYRGWRQLRAFSVRKMRVFSGDQLLYAFSVLSVDAFPMLLPLPLALVSPMGHILDGEFSVGMVLYAIAALAVYWQVAREFDDVEKTCEVPRWTRWIHPLAGLLRAVICIEAVVRMLLRIKMDWRGRPVEHHVE